MLVRVVKTKKEVSMPLRAHAPHVGAPDPEKRNSPIIEETSEDFAMMGTETEEGAACYFNGAAFKDHDHVCSGDELLRCQRGAWVRIGSCDLDNP